MELRHLRYFVAAAEEGNISKAADRLNVAQSALSRRIQALEEELGFALFVRDRKRIRITPAGSYFFTECRRILNELAAMKRHAGEIAAEHSRKMIIALNPAAALSGQIMNVLTNFQAGFPDVDTELLTMPSLAQIAAIREGEVDAGFIHMPQEVSDLQSVEVISGRLMIAINLTHDLASKPELRLADFKEEPFLWVREPDVMFAHDLALKAFRAAGFDPHIVNRVSSFEASLALVSAGAGHSLTHSLASGHNANNVIFRTPEDFDISLPLVLAWKKVSPHPLVPSLIGQLK
ncbi:LysR family transcriptional regulator [Novosphingobium sp. G106]|uniref:LysR family transcriptional regulator n=1 Tax=Novosphingobium sp. G106 TaxID=2849500 RepID=UPI001C2D063A|nr:LysR family transcriptional regulator [Novosphingobium sp. G106]MBV1688865.1 LysR family transcriptional regulator [Novosphingobium sp. G106]